MSSASAGPNAAEPITSYTLLFHACTYAYAAISSVLFAQKQVSPSDFRAAASQGSEPILRACLRSSSASHKRALLLDERDDAGRIPLMLAASQGQAASVALLLRHMPAMQVLALTTDKKTATKEEQLSKSSSSSGNGSSSSAPSQHPRCLAFSINVFNYGMFAVSLGPNAVQGMREQLNVQEPQPKTASSGSPGTVSQAAPAPTPSPTASRGDSALMFAASAGHAGCMQLLLQHSPAVQVAVANAGGHTALMMAASGGHHDCMQLLLQHRPSEQVVALSNAGLNALMLALAASSSPDLARDFGLETMIPRTPAAPESRGDSGSGKQAPAVQAPQGDHDSCVKLLLQHCPGQQLELAGPRGATALMLASAAGRAQLVQLLLQHSPDTQVVAVGPRRRTALMLAVEKGHDECVRLLLEHSPDAQVAAVDYMQRTALMMAAAGGHEDCMRRLLQHSPDSQVASVDELGKTALMFAANRGSVACVVRLLRYSPLVQVVSRTIGHEILFQTKEREGAAHRRVFKLGPDQNGSRGNSALMFAAFGGHDECVRLLLQHLPETQLTSENSSRFTALMVAAWARQVACIRALLQLCPEAQLVAASVFGRTALMLAAYRGHDACVQALLRHIPVQQVEQQNAEGRYGTPADVSFGESALILAALEGHETCLKLLLQHSPRTQVAATCRAPAHYSISCQAGAGGGGVDGVTALMAAAHRGHGGCVALLLQHSPASQVAARNAEKKSALVLAGLAKHFDCVQLLERSNPSPAASQAADLPPPTAAARAAEQQQQLNNDLVRCLLDWSKLADATAPLSDAASPIRLHIEQLLMDGAVLPAKRDLPPGSGTRDALERILWLVFRDCIARARVPELLNAAVVALAVKVARR